MAALAISHTITSIQNADSLDTRIPESLYRHIHVVEIVVVPLTGDN